MGKEEVEAAIAALEATISRIDTWVLWFAAAVAIGVAGELVLGVSHWVKDRELRPLRVLQSQLHESELASLGRDTARLSAEAEVANSEIAKANAAAAQATERAAQVQEDNTKLESLIARNTVRMSQVL